MNQEYTNIDLLNLFAIFGECSKIVTRTCRTFNTRYPNVRAITPKIFRRIYGNFEARGRQNAVRNKAHPITSNEETEINVLAYFRAYPQASIRSAQDNLGVSVSSVHRILKKYKWHDYKFTKVQHLHPQDGAARVEFCEMFLVKIQEDENFKKKVIWTDEAKFSREGIFNTRANHFWGDENPHLTKEQNFQVKFSFNVFALIKDNTLAYYIYDEALTSQKYLEILRTVVDDFVDNLPLNEAVECWYQLDGAPAHCTEAVSRELYQMFEDRWFRRLGPWSWPARSPDLSPLDFYLWGTIKNKVYTNTTPLRSKDELRNRVQAAFQELDPEELGKATSNVEVRIRKCLNINGGHFEHLLKIR